MEQKSVDIKQISAPNQNINHRKADVKQISTIMGKNLIKAYPLRMNPELKDELIKISEIEGRTLNKQIEYILKEYVKEKMQKMNKEK